jgi:hypothetical protein
MVLVQKPKHVASYCKQKGIYLPVNLCPMCRNVFLVHFSFCHRLSADVIQVKGTAAL